MKLFNDFYKKEMEFKAIEENKIKIYVCGPTVYDSPHIGHARAAVAFDILRRYFIYQNYEVIYASNYTDVDDKMISRAHLNRVSVSELAKKYIDEYENVMRELNVLTPDIKPQATQSIDAIIELINLILKNGYGYESNGSVYFDVEKFSEDNEYDGLFMRKIHKDEETEEGVEEEEEEEEESHHIHTDDTDMEKKNVRDFALWKKAKPNEPKWDSPWGEGRPGWHIECSAMVYRNLGKEIDIHGGGKDLIFPHHTNEVAQTKAAVGTNLARFWIHNGFVNVDNVKMSKSLNNFFSAEEVLKKYDGMVIRLFLSSVNYRKPINYSIETLDEAQIEYNKIKSFYDTLKTFKISNEVEKSIKKNLNEEIEKLRKIFFEEMDNDLNTAEALNQIFSLIRIVNKHIFEDHREIDDETKKQIIEFLIDFSNIFGILLDETMQQLGVYGIVKSNMDSLIQQKEDEINNLVDLLINIRADLRKKKMYKESDKIRDKLKEIGIELNDMKEKTIWKYISE